MRLKATRPHYKDLTEEKLEKETSDRQMEKEVIFEIKNAYIVLLNQRPRGMQSQ